MNINSALPGRRTSKAVDQVVVHEPGCLHQGVTDGRADERESTTLQVLTQCIGNLGASGKFGKGPPVVLNRPATDKRPDVLIEAAELLLEREEHAGITDG